MKITDVRIKLIHDPDQRLQAFCSVTLDDSFVIRDIKIIQGSSGPFIAMPSRKIASHCSKCGHKNHLRANFCNNCGDRQQHGGQEGKRKLYADIAHPINAECRERIQTRVIEALVEEMKMARKDGYVCRYDEAVDATNLPQPKNDVSAGQSAQRNKGE